MMPDAQQEIVRRAEGLFALAGQLEVRLVKARGQVDRLTPSLPPSPGYGGTGLARAFAGKLVPQDPTEKSSEKLLERIAAQRQPVAASRQKQRQHPGSSNATQI